MSGALVRPAWPHRLWVIAVLLGLLLPHAAQSQEAEPNERQSQDRPLETPQPQQYPQTQRPEHPQTQRPEHPQTQPPEHPQTQPPEQPQTQPPEQPQQQTPQVVDTSATEQGDAAPGDTTQEDPDQLVLDTAPADPSTDAEFRQPDTQVESPDPLEQVVVSGEQPGPGLWKVTNGANTLWIISTVSPTPKGLKWRSRQVESIVASAGLVFADFEVKPNIGIFRGLRYLPAVLRARFNPDKVRLKDLITPEQYAKWLPLRKEYFKDDDDIEKVRPMLIAFALYSKAMEKAELRDASAVGRVVEASAKKHRVKWKTTEIKIDIQKPKELIKAFVETTPRENDVGCFLAALDNLDAEIEVMKQRAAAWAVGDVEAFRKLPRPAVQRKCMEAVTSAPAVHALLGSVIDRFSAAWRTEADAALASHATSIALIDLDSLIREDGIVSHLRARGYTVEEPQ